MDAVAEDDSPLRGLRLICTGVRRMDSSSRRRRFPAKGIETWGIRPWRKPALPVAEDDSPLRGLRHHGLTVWHYYRHVAEDDSPLRGLSFPVARAFPPAIAGRRGRFPTEGIETMSLSGAMG